MVALQHNSRVPFRLEQSACQAGGIRLAQCAKSSVVETKMGAVTADKCGDGNDPLSVWPPVKRLGDCFSRALHRIFTLIGRLLFYGLRPRRSLKFGLHGHGILPLFRWWVHFTGPD